MEINDKVVLVTGAGGFIGSHLVEMLLAKGAHVRALVHYNSRNSWGWLEALERLHDIDVVTGDVRDPHVCQRLVKGVDIVFNLAALIAIPYSYLAPESYVDTNVNGALHICQAALEQQVRKVIQISTSEVYGTALYVPIDEKHPLQPQSPYSASKIGSDAIALSFYHAFDLPVTIARPFNTYGPRQSARAVIPTIITQIASGVKEIRLGNVEPTRDLTYVGDTCRGLIALAECDHVTGEVVNIGSNVEIRIREVFRLIAELMGSDVQLITDESRIRPGNSEVERLWCDNTKIKKLTGFLPVYPIEEGLQLTIAWFQKAANLQLYKPAIYNV